MYKDVAPNILLHRPFAPRYQAQQFSKIPPLSSSITSRILLGWRRRHSKCRAYESTVTEKVSRPHYFQDNQASPWQRRGRWQNNMPLVIVHLGVLAHQLLLPLLVGPVPSDLVAVFFGLQEGDQVDASPHLLTGQLAMVQIGQSRVHTCPSYVTMLHISQLNSAVLIRFVSSGFLRSEKGNDTYLASRMPPISLYQPKPMMAPAPSSKIPGRKPLAGRFRCPS